MRGDGEKEKRKLLKIFPFASFLLILRVNKMTEMEEMRVKYSPSFLFPSIYLIFI